MITLRGSAIRKVGALSQRVLRFRPDSEEPRPLLETERLASKRNPV